MKISEMVYGKLGTLLESSFKIANTLPMGGERKLISYFLKMATEAQIFMLEPSIHDGMQTRLVDINANVLDCALPFKTCYFEVNDTDLSIDKIVSPEGDAWGIYGILVEETAPACFSGVLLMDVQPMSAIPFFLDLKNENAVPVEYNTSGVKNIEKMAAYLVHKICVYIHDCNLGTERVFRTVDFKTQTFGSCRHKVTHISRLSPKHGTSYPEPSFSREIDWDMRWHVRGHWRSLPAAHIKGKDRNGEYTVSGFTWVTEHLRGPESAPIKKATYSLEGTCQH